MIVETAIDSFQLVHTSLVALTENFPISFLLESPQHDCYQRLHLDGVWQDFVMLRSS